MMKRITAVAAMFIGLVSGCAAQSTTSSTTNTVIAKIDGTDVTRELFDRRVAARLFQARNTYHEAERKALDEFIDELLLEQQAKKENTTIPVLLDRHVNSKITSVPTDEALRVYYDGLDVAEPFEAVREKIIEHLRQRRIAKLKTAYVQQLRKQAKVDIQLLSPRIQVPMTNVLVRGNADAPVTIVEYADYECPYCQQIQPALDKLRTDFKDRVAFVYKDVPLPNHPNAQKAAEAKHCASKQGKYWEYHDLLVSKNQYQIPALKQNARTLNLDAVAFDKCLDMGEQAGIVLAHGQEAQTLGLQGTPSFFINGRFFSGVLTYEKLREVVEEELSGATGSSNRQTASTR